VAIGGGALTDVAGLAACLYKRGMPLVTVPTTLLAQVDGGLGGKNAINAFGLKNSLGSFWFPRAIICASKYLETLPLRQFNSGMGEVWKYRLLFAETDWRGLKSLGPRDVTHQFISRAIAYKCQVVAADPLDLGERRRLNLGHTLAHALEGVLPILHGEAVLWGLEFALLAAVTSGHCPQEEARSALRALASQPRLRLPRLAFSQLWPLLQGDKKNAELTKITLILPSPGGQVAAEEFTRRELEECWRLMQKT
jgi:3-dehydroquinate synthetase